MHMKRTEIHVVERTEIQVVERTEVHVVDTLSSGTKFKCQASLFS